MKITCYKHKSFRGVRKPTSGCPACFFVWLIQRAKKLFGFEYARPQRTTFPGIAFGVDPHPFRVSVDADHRRVAAKISECLSKPSCASLFIAETEGELLKKKVQPPYDRCDG